MDLAPIIVFCYNRPWHVEQTLEALTKNELANQSTLFIYCDGPKDSATDEQKQKITEVRQVIRQKQWCKEVYIIEAEKNKGLANSIIGGVTEVVNKYGKVIVLEDDIVTSIGFLCYMNDALNIYAKEEKVMHISAYMYPHRNILPRTFFYEVPYPGGGWATWKRAWQYYNDNIEELYQYYSTRWDEFNKYGADYLQKQLQQNFDGVLHTWFIRWHAVLLQKGGLTLYPYRSLTQNIGFDETASNCYKTDKFDVPKLAKSVEVKKKIPKEDKRASRTIYAFYQGYWYNRRRRQQLFNRIKDFFWT